MLARLLDRTTSETVLFALVSSLLWYFRTTAHPALLISLGLVSTYLYLTSMLRAFRNERALVALGGGQAPSVRTHTPFNLGMVMTSLYYFWGGSDRQFWYWVLRWNRTARPYTVQSLVMGESIVLTIDEENIKAVLATQFADFGKGEQFREEWKEFLGLSIFTTDGEMWHNSRGLLRPQFIKDRVSDLKIFEHHIQILLPLLGGAQPGATVRADDLFFRYTLDSATAYLLGHSGDSLRNGEDEFARAFALVQRVQGAIARAGPFASWIPRKKFRASLVVIDDFVNRYIERALALSPGEGGPDENTFLHALARVTRDRKVLRDQILAVLLAGRDTTAITLSWLFYELSRHPAVVGKLRAEILRVVGPNRPPTYADLHAMTYLRHTISETLRLYPVVPDNVRIALRDTTLPRGGGPNGDQPIAVLKDTSIGYSTFCLQRRADIYGGGEKGGAGHSGSEMPSYLDFEPERWRNWTPRPWTYIPFNGGPRLCVGQQFALTEMAYTVVRILQTYARVEPRQDEFPSFQSAIVLQPARGIDVAFWRE